MTIPKIDITKEEDDICNAEAVYLYGYLRKKYCNENIQDLDIIMNSLCFALLRLVHHCVKKSERKKMALIIHQIILNNLDEESE